MTASSPPATNATDPLRADHVLILAVVSAVEREAARVAGGGVAFSWFWSEAIEFLSGFAAGVHFGQEEDCLFPALIEAGIPDRGGPVGLLRHEHEQCHAVLRQLGQARATQNVPALIDAAHRCAALLRDHISKEDRVLYVLAERVLSPERTVAVRDALERYERAHSQIDHERQRDLVAALCLHAGIGVPAVGSGSTSTHHERGPATSPPGSEEKETKQ